MKVAVVGAGSTEFSLKLIRDLCLAPNLGGSTVHLMDVDQVRLDAVHALLVRYAAEVGADLDVRSSTERTVALTGADFVVNTALTAPNAQLFDGWRIAEARGYRHGGSLHVMHDEAFWINFHQLRFFCSLVEDMLAICPGAWLIEVANPVFAGVTHLARTYPQAKIVGLCHGFREVYAIADALGLDHERLTFEIPGVNHFVWLAQCRHDGRDVMPLFDEWLEEKADRHWARCPSDDQLGPKQVDLYRRFGVFPIGDTGTWGGGSWGWMYHTDAEVAASWNVDPARRWEAKFEGDRERLELIRRLSDSEDIEISSAVPPQPSGEVIVPLIEAIACDIPRVLIGNVLNAADSVSGLPRDIAVEIPLSASGDGLLPMATTPLPAPVIAHALRDYVAAVNLELTAFEGRSRSSLLELVLTDPWTTSDRQARGLLDAILAMPVHADMRDHYE
jgi:alpha-galactosidase